MTFACFCPFVKGSHGISLSFSMEAAEAPVHYFSQQVGHLGARLSFPSHYGCIQW